MCNRKLDMGVDLHRLQGAVCLTLVGEGAYLNGPLAWRRRAATSG
jgi:hypothetical protein